MMEKNTVESKPSLRFMVDDILAEHHEPTRKWLDQVKALLQKAANEDLGNTLVNKLGMSFQGLAMTMYMHMEKEEQVLFPMFQRMEEGFDSARHCGGIENPIRVMESEHKDLDQHFERIHFLTENYRVSDAISPTVVKIYEILQLLEADLKVHSQKEEKELFPAAVARERGSDHAPWQE